MEEEGEKKKKFWGLKKTIGIALLILLLLFIFIGIGVWSGLKDIADDEKILMVVEEGNVAKAASIYDTESGEGKAVNVEVLPALSDIKTFYDAVVTEYGSIDRMIIADTEAIYTLSMDPSIEFRGTNVDRNTLVDWVIGKSYPPQSLQGDQVPWDFRADLLNEWFDYYYDRLDQGKYRKFIIDTGMDLYRDGHIKIYESNIALTVLKYIPIEKIIP
ncbi:MAG: hypothetical protein KAT49_01965 [Methanomicrobia archaeon]|nr:hypothetical protein [Methanomicrobia archaeon]